MPAPPTPAATSAFCRTPNDATGRPITCCMVSATRAVDSPTPRTWTPGFTRPPARPARITGSPDTLWVLASELSEWHITRQLSSSVPSPSGTAASACTNSVQASIVRITNAVARGW